MQGFNNREGKSIVLGLIKTIQDNKEYLSEIDGAIGDGDHGINMSKGFTICGERLRGKEVEFGEALSILGDVLFNEIGGSMGPLYGQLFTEMGNNILGQELITVTAIERMLGKGVEALQEIVDANVGDKTLMDVLIPARDSIHESIKRGEDIVSALEEMKKAVTNGRDATKDMVAKYGRASRLGDRSKGVIDPGAASCCLLLTTMADEMLKLIIE